MHATVRGPSPLSDDDIIRISRDNPGWHVEYVDGALVMTPPAGDETTFRNAALTAILVAWADAHGFVAGDSSGGFKMPNKDVRAPDGCLVRADRLRDYFASGAKGFVALVPDVVVELRSSNDSRTELERKCERWRAYGVAHVVLLDPQRRDVKSWGEAPPGFDEIDWSRVIAWPGPNSL